VSRLTAEFRAIPWNARGRKVGRIVGTIAGVILLLAPAWVEPLIFGLIGR
jgi:hypothetical protein